MSRLNAAAFAAAAALPSARVFGLVELQFASGPQYLCELDHSVTYSGATYLPALGFMQVDPVAETGNSFQGLRLTLAGVSVASVAMALGERVQGRTIILRLAALDAADAVQVDPNVWSGYMDTMTLSDAEDGSSSIVITAEHRMAVWDRPRVRRYTDAQQQAAYPGDTGLRYIADVANSQIVWPSRAFYLQQ